jgi:lipoprotein-anchoring transpeptidase ErfK/SrfK
VLRRPGAMVSLLVVAVLAAGCAGSRAALPVHDARVPKTTTTTTPVPPPAVPVSTLVATTHGAVPGSPSPGAQAASIVPADWYGYQTILPVIARQPGWLEVRLAQRPNQSTTWIPSGDATLSSTPYRIVIDLTTERLEVFQSGYQIMSFPAGVGTTTDPTVPGSYFVTMIAPAPDPGYGPFVIVTSEHSDTISDWEQSGDAIMAIHGPIDSYDDSLIGTTGARISHGCVRLHDNDLAQLAPIPVGTPIDIVN